MNSTIEQMYPEIAEVALGLAEDRVGKLLLYAEVFKGVISANVFYMSRTGMVRFRFGSSSLQELIHSFWKRWKEQPGNREWRAMSFIIERGTFKVELSYPEELEPGEAVTDHRPRTIKKYFGDLMVDYSKP